MQGDITRQQMHVSINYILYLLLLYLLSQQTKQQLKKELFCDHVLGFFDNSALVSYFTSTLEPVSFHSNSSSDNISILIDMRWFLTSSPHLLYIHILIGRTTLQWNLRATQENITTQYTYIALEAEKSLQCIVTGMSLR